LEAAAANGPACDEPAIEAEFAGKVRVRIPDSVPVDVPAAASGSAKLLKLRVKRLPASRDTGVADEAFFGISFGHTLRRT
jgi:hypothetical protein